MKDMKKESSTNIHFNSTLIENAYLDSEQGAKKYQALHVLQIEGVGNNTQITIRLFRWIVTQVIFS